jgi:hypothetical protein
MRSRRPLSRNVRRIAEGFEKNVPCGLSQPRRPHRDPHLAAVLWRPTDPLDAPNVCLRGGAKPASELSPDHYAVGAGLLPRKSDPISLDTVSTTMTAAKEVEDGREKAEADSWQ